MPKELCSNTSSGGHGKAVEVVECLCVCVTGALGTQKQLERMIFRSCCHMVIGHMLLRMPASYIRIPELES